MDNIVLSGQPAVIIKCGCDFSVNGTQFKEGQVVACITDCDVSFTYAAANRPISQGAATLGYAEKVELNSVRITAVPFNKMLSQIVFSSTNTEFTKPYVVNSVSDSDGIVALGYDDIQNIQVLDNDYTPVEYTFDEETKLITIAPDTRCKVYFDIPLKNCTTNKVMPKSLPYFILECVSKGNMIGESREPITQVIKIKRAALQLDPFFRFNNGLDKFDLHFRVIKDDINEIGYGRE